MENARTNFRDLHEAGYTADVLPISRPNWKPDPKSSLKLDQLGKIPAALDEQTGLCRGLVGWTSHRATVAHLKKYQKWEANRGLQTRFLPACDADINDEKVAAAIYDCVAEIITGPVRYREGSPRWLLLCRLKKGTAPTRKRRLVWVDVNDKEHALEWLGDGGQCVIGGVHPSGKEYFWRDGLGPCEWGRDNLPEVDNETVDRIFAAVTDLIETMGYGRITTNHKSGAGGKRKVLPDQSLSASSLDLVKEALAATPVDVFSTRDELVTFLVAVKASAGEHADELYPDVLEWALQYPGCEEEFIENIWTSIRDAELGAEWLFGFARKYGFHEDAQADFADNAGEPADAIPETPFDRMLGRYAWVENVGRYNDTKNGGFLTSKDLNAANTGVAPFGRSGVQTAEAEFQNAPGALKVAVATSRPGAPLITTEANDRGIPVKAVNLWRPSNIKPNHSATTADVAPWLDLVDKLFGAQGAPEREHFLDVLAYVLQKPGEKIGHALVIIGGQGTGKDTVLAPFFEAVGSHNVAAVDANTLVGQWTHFLKAQIVYGQEVITRGRNASIYNHLKPFISGQKTRLQVNEKGMKQYFVPNNQNWVFTSNYDNALTLDDDDRRFWVHRVLLDEPPPDDYFARLHSWFAASGTENVFGWLLKRDVSGFNPMARPPMTAAKRTMLEQSQPAPVRWLRDQLREGGEFAARMVMAVCELLKAADQDFNAPQGLNDRHVMVALKGEGFKAAHRVRIGRDMRPLWVRDPLSALGRLSADQLRDRYISEVSGGGSANEGEGNGA
jgi:hypothetical protein